MKGITMSKLEMIAQSLHKSATMMQNRPIHTVLFEVYDDLYHRLDNPAHFADYLRKNFSLQYDEGMEIIFNEGNWVKYIRLSAKRLVNQDNFKAEYAYLYVLHAYILPKVNL